MTMGIRHGGLVALVGSVHHQALLGRHTDPVPERSR